MQHARVRAPLSVFEGVTMDLRPTKGDEDTSLTLWGRQSCLQPPFRRLVSKVSRLKAGCSQDWLPHNMPASSTEREVNAFFRHYPPNSLRDLRDNLEDRRLMSISEGKVRHMKALSNKNGVIAAAAMDQRGSLQKASRGRACR